MSLCSSNSHSSAIRRPGIPTHYIILRPQPTTPAIPTSGMVLLKHAFVFGGLFFFTFSTGSKNPLASYKILPQVLSKLSEDASDVLEASSAFSRHHFSIFKGLRDEREAGVSVMLCDFICENYVKSKYQGLDKKSPEFWSALIDEHFFNFARAYKAGAQEILDELVIPEHSFSKELMGRLKVEDLIEPSKKHKTLDSLLESLVKEEFNRKMSEIFEKTDQLCAQFEYYVVLKKYAEAVSWKNYKLAYGCHFLMTVPLWKTKDLIHRGTVSYNGVYYLTNVMAHNICKAILLHESPQHAHEALKKVFPSMPEHNFENYMDAIDMFIKEELESEEFMVHQEVFIQLFREALQNHTLLARLSPVYLSVMHAFSQNTELSKSFSRFIRQNYLEMQVEDRELLYFWVQLIERQFALFVQSHQEQAKKFFNEPIIPSHPFFAELYFTFDFDLFLVKKCLWMTFSPVALIIALLGN